MCSTTMQQKRSGSQAALVTSLNKLRSDGSEVHKLHAKGLLACTALLWTASSLLQHTCLTPFEHMVQPQSVGAFQFF